MNRTILLKLIQGIVSRNGAPCPALQESSQLRELGFRSLDFAELCLRVEENVGHELDLGAGTVRQIQTVGDVCDLLEKLAA